MKYLKIRLSKVLIKGELLREQSDSEKKDICLSKDTHAWHLKPESHEFEWFYMERPSYVC